MLPSSPPQRMRPRSGSEDSDYSLNLDALLPEESEMMTPPKKSIIDVVHSEDIDGPTDFTQNLEYWMSAKLPHVPSPTVTKPASLPEGRMRGQFEEFVSSDDMQEEGTLERANCSGGADHGTPRTVERASLQPSVEDYEDSPAPRNRIMASRRSSELERLPHNPEDAPSTTITAPMSDDNARNNVEEKTDTITKLEEALQKLKDELSSVRSQSQHELGRLRADTESKLEENRTSYEQRMKQERASFEEELKTVKDTANTQIATLDKEHKAALADLRLQHSKDSQSNEETRINKLELQLQLHKDEFQKVKRENTAMERDLEALQEQHRITIEDLAEERRDNDAEYEALKSKLESTEARKLDAEEAVQNLHAELAHLKMTHESKIDEMTSKLEDAEHRILRATAQDRATSQETMKQLESENAMLHHQLDEKDDEIEGIKKQVKMYSKRMETMRGEITAVTTKTTEQNTLNEKAAREIQSLLAGTKILQAKLKDATTSLASSRKDSKSTELQLEAMCAQILQAESEAASARNEMQQLTEDYKAINKVMDKKMRDVMKSREAEWKRKFELLEQENVLRGRVLMREWGVRQMGEADPQGYRYQYM